MTAPAGPPIAPLAEPAAAARQPGNPLHDITLQAMLAALVNHYGWEELGQRIRIRCFTSEPSVVSSLKFLRRTPWAREKVESLYSSCCARSNAPERRFTTFRRRVPEPCWPGIDLVDSDESLLLHASGN